MFLDMSWYSNYDAAFKTTNEESWIRENIHKVYADHMDDVILQGEFDKFAVFAKRIVDTTQGASVYALAGKNSVGQRRMWEHCQESEKLILKKSSIISVKTRTINGFCDPW